MSRTAILILTSLLLAASAHCQAEAPSAADRAAIAQTALDFEESWYAGDAARMARALHPRFVMRHVGTDPHSGASILTQDIGAQQLIELTREGKGKVAPDRQRHDVTVLDVFANAATAKIVAWYGVDYLELALWNGRWVVVNVLWGKNPG
ncbi:MAG: hypothetical protein HOQ10_07725 [Frateuria sp.]|nr:hypothetical protein [Frateuria sp.]